MAMNRTSPTRNSAGSKAENPTRLCCMLHLSVVVVSSFYFTRNKLESRVDAEPNPREREASSHGFLLLALIKRYHPRRRGAETHSFALMANEHIEVATRCTLFLGTAKGT